MGCESHSVVRYRSILQVRLPDGARCHHSVVLYAGRALNPNGGNLSKGLRGKGLGVSFDFVYKVIGDEVLELRFASFWTGVLTARTFVLERRNSGNQLRSSSKLVIGQLIRKLKERGAVVPLQFFFIPIHET